MPVINGNDVIEIKLNGTLFGQRMINVFHYNTYVPPSAPDYIPSLNALLTWFDTSAFKTKFLLCCPSDYLLDSMTAQKVSPTREVFVAKTMGINGTAAAADPCQNANGVLTKKTAHVGNHTAGVYTYKGSTGSVHFPGLPSGAAVAGLVTLAYQVTMVTFGDQVIAPIINGDGSEYRPVLWHRLAAPQPQVDSLISTFPQPQVRIMRRRTVGQGI